ncbi:uncharacterized protein RCC_01183 [Ramularia collo-cygni]|uniref:Ubiquitin carboxyl-terminal hydrolase n=1 Tax=Ramularia collo-cygni TaxID=112498 RepID=A0A2D3URZ2_9PEZI|nr:uncharacterized protein RCC_01183 [Ramularia collo-cygni]CZT15320.1 uncharacterized protein RCC_01183 [Ramularia collo-cygni]
MHTLQRYLKDALDPAVEKRRLMAANKLFQTTFGMQGRDCNVLLNRMGFTFVPQHGDDEARWNLPNPPPIEDRLGADGSSPREILEDIEAEAVVYVGKLSLAAGESNPVAARGGATLALANREVERVLGAQDYPTFLSLKRPQPNDLRPYFASLGALPNFTDTLLEYAFDRQFDCDPAFSAYYLECLQAISEERGTEQLQIKVAVLQSQDLVSRRDLRAAYRFLDVKQEDTDEQIVNKFNVRQSNCGTQIQEENRQALGKIGIARQSPRLNKAARQELETYDDALSWVGVSRDTETDFVLSMLVQKADESRSDAEMAKKAASIIAKERGESGVIHNWLAGNATGTSSMGVDEALRVLNIEVALKSIDQATLQVIFDSARSDKPGAHTDNAISAIEKHLAAESSRPPELWPVGLTSHGNTCYLNSLLQYYFSIKPLREIVLDYDQYKLDTAAHSEKMERVGQRIITTVEIQGGQKFADDLKYLFERMIKDRQSHIKPEEDLVCRAFLEPKDYALLTSEVRGDKGNGAKPKDTAMEVDEITDKVTAEDTPQSGASSVTLAEEDTAMKDHDSPPTPPGSPAQNATKGDNPEPTEPPPLPPRRFSTTKEQALLKAEQNARQQQDVTEVHDGAMFRLRSGMIAKGMDDRGEQQDQLRDIFEISLRATTVQEDGSETSKMEASSSITTDVPNESTDVYALLDKFFDEQDIPGTNKTTYKTIDTAPPLLQIAIPRIGYDSKRGAFKSEELVLLHDEVYLDRYMDVAGVLPRRRTCWGWRKQLKAWKRERNYLSKTTIEQDGPTVLSECANLLRELGSISDELEDVGMGEGIDVEPDLPDEVESEAASARSRVTKLQQQIDELQASFNEQFGDMKEVKYELAAVFIHRGGNSSGHYWIYIRDFHKNCWRSYNDETVTELSHEELHAATREAKYSNGTPTYAVYVRESEKDYVRPVCRAPEPAPEVVWHDSWAEDASRATNARSNEGTVQEGGNSKWDEQRQVPADGW